MNKAFQVAPVLILQEMTKKDRDAALKLLKKLELVKPDGTALIMNFGAMLSKVGPAKYKFKEKEYTIDHRKLGKICNKYFPDEYAFQPFIFWYGE